MTMSGESANPGSPEELEKMKEIEDKLRALPVDPLVKTVLDPPKTEEATTVCDAEFSMPEKILRHLLGELSFKEPFIYGRDFKIQFLDDTEEILIDLTPNFGLSRKVGSMKIVINVKGIKPLTCEETTEET